MSEFPPSQGGLGWVLSLLLYKVHTTLDELAQCLTLEHAVTQEGKVDELVQHLVVLGEVGVDGFALGALGINLGVEFAEFILLG